jgi:hypothetical protein
MRSLCMSSSFSSCAVAAQRFTFVLRPGCTQAALLPLQKLSALTLLKVYGVVDAAAVAASAAAQITGLKQLKLWDLSQPTDPALLQLTALKGLSKLALGGTYPKWQDESGPFIVESRVSLLLGAS